MFQQYKHWMFNFYVLLWLQKMDNNVQSTNNKNQERRERDRARRNSLTVEQKEEINARRREARQNKGLDERNARQRDRRKNISLEERQKNNAERRTSRQSITREERTALLGKRKANAAAKRNTPCAESIAMPYPNTTNLQKTPSTSTPEYTIRTEGNTLIFTSFIYAIIVLTSSRML